MSGGGSEAVKYVTILDLKERWLKKKQQEADEEERRKKKKEAEELRIEESEKKKNKNVCDSLNELKIGQKDDRVDAGSAGGSKIWSGGRGRWRMRRGGLNGNRSGEKMNGYRKKKDLEVDDVNIDEDERAKFIGGRYGKGKGYVRDGSCVKGSESDVNVNVDVDVKSGVETMGGVSGSVGDEKVGRTNCPIHSRSENLGSGGFWVCKYIEPGSGVEFEGSGKGSDDVKGDLVDNAEKKSGKKEGLELLNKHKLHGKGRGKLDVEREKEDAMQVKADYHDDVLWKTRQQQEKRLMINGVKDKMIKGVKDTVVVTQMQKELVEVYKHSRTIMNCDGRGNFGQKHGMKLHSDTAGPSFEIQEHHNCSEAAESETKHKGKIRARGNQVNGRKIYDTGKFKAEENFGSLAMEFVKKDTLHVSNSCKKMVDKVGHTHGNYDSTPALEYIKPVDFLEKSVSSLGTEIVKNCGDKFRDRRNGLHPMKKFVKNWHQTERIFAKAGNVNSGKFNDRMQGSRLEKGGFMWVKKGEGSGDNECSKG